MRFGNSGTVIESIMLLDIQKFFFKHKIDINKNPLRHIVMIRLKKKPGTDIIFEDGWNSGVLQIV